MKYIIIYILIAIACFGFVFRLLWVEDHPEEIARFNEEQRQKKRRSVPRKRLAISSAVGRAAAAKLRPTNANTGQIN